jgi:inhibitor of cysteine peptidase
VKARLFVIVVMLVSLVMSGCASQDNRPQTTTTTQPPTIEASGADNGKELTMSVGDTLRLTLVANHSIPFWWAVDTLIADNTILQQTGHEFTASATTTGGDGSEFWTFKALKAGTTTITNQEASVANPGMAPLKSFTAKVTVK